jgi:glutaredoxin
MTWNTTNSAAESPPSKDEFNNDLLRMANRLQKGLTNGGDKKIGLNIADLPGMLKKYGISQEVINRLGHDPKKMEEVMKNRICLQDCVTLYMRSQAEQMAFLTGIYTSNKSWSGTDKVQMKIATKRVLDFDTAQLQAWGRAAEQQRKLFDLLDLKMPALTSLDTVSDKKLEDQLAAHMFMLQLTDEAKADYIATVPGDWARVEKCQSSEQCDGTSDELSLGRIPRYGGVCVQNRCYDSRGLHEWITDKQKKEDCVTDRYGHTYTQDEIQRVKEVNQRGYKIFYKDGCSWCDRALNFVKANNLKHALYDLNQAENFRWLKKNLPSWNGLFPQVFFNGEHIGGCTALENHNRR